MLFIDSTSYSCYEGKYCQHTGPSSGAEDEQGIIKLCEDDPKCVAYDYSAESSMGRICYALFTMNDPKYKICKKGTQCISK